MQVRCLGWLAFALVFACLAPVEGADSIKKLKKDIKKILISPNASADDAIPFVKEIAAIGGKKAIEALYDIALKNASTAEFYQAVLVELGGIEIRALF